MLHTLQGPSCEYVCSRSWAFLQPKSIKEGSEEVLELRIVFDISVGHSSSSKRFTPRKKMTEGYIFARPQMSTEKQTAETPLLQSQVRSK